MSDETKEKATTEPVDVEKLKERISFLETETKNAFSRRDLAVREAQELKTFVEAKDKEAVELAKQKARSKGDVEALETSYKQELERIRTRESQLEKSLHTHLVTNSVTQKGLAKGLSPKGVEMFLKFRSSDLGVETNEDGTSYVKVRNSVKSLDEELEAFVQEFPAVKANPVKSGAGSRSNTERGSEPLTKEDLQRLSSEERQALAFKDPEKYKQIILGNKRTSWN